MNRIETQETIKQFSRIQPAYSGWRSEAIRRNATANRTDEAEEWSAMLDSIARTLSGVTAKEGQAVVSRMESGNLPIPPYGELALTILREVKISRQPANQYHDSQPRYQCLTCLDTGLVNAWNPSFVEAYRTEFAKVSRTEIDRDAEKRQPRDRQRLKLDLDRYDPERTIAAWKYDPVDWEHQAKVWWRGRRDSFGPIHHVALCDCNCPRKRVLEDQLDQYNRGDRKSSDGRKASLPACGAVKFDPTRMPVKTPRSYEDLVDWYAKNEINSAYEWPQEATA